MYIVHRFIDCSRQDYVGLLSLGSSRCPRSGLEELAKSFFQLKSSSQINFSPNCKKRIDKSKKKHVHLNICQTFLLNFNFDVFTTHE